MQFSRDLFETFLELAVGDRIVDPMRWEIYIRSVSLELSHKWVKIA